MTETNDTPSNGTPSTAITVTGYEADHITSAIVDAAARQLLNATSFDEDGDPVSYRNDLAQRLERQVKETVAQFAAEQAEPILREALAKPIPRVNRYGETERGTRTLAEAISEEVREALQVGHRDRYGDRKAPLLQQMLRDEVDKLIRGDLQDEIDRARAQVRQAVKEKAAELLTAETMRAAGIR